MIAAFHLGDAAIVRAGSLSLLLGHLMELNK